MLLVCSAVLVMLALSLHESVRGSLVCRSANEAFRREIKRRDHIEEKLRRALRELNSHVQERAAAIHDLKRTLSCLSERQHQLAARFCGLQNEERRRIGRELHDGTTQNLVAVAMNLARLRSHLPADILGKSHELSDSVQLVDMSIQDLRTMSHLLHPPAVGALGLPATLRAFVEGFTARSGIQVVVEVPSDLGPLDRDTELAVFRIVQECLANIHRHSLTGTAKLTIARAQDVLEVYVADDGSGIPSDVLKKIESGTAGVGFLGMQETASLLGGVCELKPSIHGTVVHVRLPLVGSRKAAIDAQDSGAAH